MNRSDSPAKQPKPFGINGLREALLDVTPDGDNSASYADGFPGVTMILKSDGGLPPKGQDMNQILYELSALCQWFSAGALNAFDSTFAGNISGYPVGAVLLSNDGDTIYINTTDANSTDPNAGGAGWKNLVDFIGSESEVLQAIAESTGAGLMGTTKGKTVQAMFDDIQNGTLDIYSNKNFFDRLNQTGMFSYTEIPGYPKGVAGFVFGDNSATGNRGAIIIDERGRQQNFTMVNGKLTSSRVAMPFTMGTGYFNNQFEDRVARFPVDGQEDDDLTPGILFTWDTTARKYRIGIMSPFMAGNNGYPQDGFNDTMNLQASYYDLGYGLNHSFDHFFTTDTGSYQWGKICSVTAGSAGGAIKKMSAIITSGSYVNYEQGTFLLEVNGQNLVSTLVAGNISQKNISQWIKFTRMASDTVVNPALTDIPEVGVVYNATTLSADVYMKVPYFSPRTSITVLALSNPTYITVDWSAWGSNSLLTTMPAGLIYTQTISPIDHGKYVRTNSGAVVSCPYVAMRVKDLLSTTGARYLNQYLEYGFTSYGTYHATNKYSGAGITVTKSSTGTYVVTGASLSSYWWNFKEPVIFGSGTASSDTKAGIVTITSTGTNTFTFTLRLKAYSNVVDTTVSPPTVTTTDSLGALIDIPDGCWIDFHVIPA